MGFWYLLFKQDALHRFDSDQTPLKVGGYLNFVSSRDLDAFT